jgi:predicted nucleotidyltransferase
MKKRSSPNSALVLKRNLPRLRQLFAQDSRVLGVWLFGSLADGYATPRSDIDLAVLFDRELDLRDELDFEVAVSQVLGTDDVDVINLNRANLSFRFRAVAGKLLYERDCVRVSDFIEQTLIEQRDFEPRAQAALQDYFDALGEDYAPRSKARERKS